MPAGGQHHQQRQQCQRHRLHHDAALHQPVRQARIAAADHRRDPDAEDAEHPQHRQHQQDRQERGHRPNMVAEDVRNNHAGPAAEYCGRAVHRYREATAMSPTDLANTLGRPGRVSLPYVDPFSPDRRLVLECFRPQRHDPDKPVVIVQHGMSRNGAEYCEAWVPAAERHGFLVVAITFPKEAWPDAVTYNNGHVLAEDGTLRQRDGWSLAIPGRVFALLREAGVTRREKIHLWGHSAGGQFVHRLLATQPHGSFAAVGAANSGWYTLPTLDVPYPDGLGGIGLTQDDVVRFLGYPLVIFSGSWLSAGDPFRRRGHRRYGREL